MKLAFPILGLLVLVLAGCAATGQSTQARADYVAHSRAQR